MTKIIKDASKYKDIGISDPIEYIEEHYQETAKEFQKIQFEQW